MSFESPKSLPGKLAAHVGVHQVILGRGQAPGDLVVRYAQLIETLRLRIGQRTEEVLDQKLRIMLFRRHRCPDKRGSTELFHAFVACVLRQVSSLSRIRHARMLTAFIVRPSRAASSRRRSILARCSPR